MAAAPTSQRLFAGESIVLSAIATNLGSKRIVLFSPSSYSDVEWFFADGTFPVDDNGIVREPTTNAYSGRSLAPGERAGFAVETSSSPVERQRGRTLYGRVAYDGRNPAYDDAENGWKAGYWPGLVRAEPFAAWLEEGWVYTTTNWWFREDWHTVRTAPGYMIDVLAKDGRASEMVVRRRTSRSIVKRVRSLGDLAGFVRIGSQAEALAFVRMRTSLLTGDLLGNGTEPRLREPGGYPPVVTSKNGGFSVARMLERVPGRRSTVVEWVGRTGRYVSDRIANADVLPTRS